MILWEAVPQRKSPSYQNLGDQNHCLSVDIIVLLSSLVDTGSLIVEYNAFSLPRDVVSLQFVSVLDFAFGG